MYKFIEILGFKNSNAEPIIVNAEPNNSDSEAETMGIENDEGNQGYSVTVTVNSDEDKEQNLESAKNFTETNLNFVNSKNMKGKTALHKAVTQDNLELVKTLSKIQTLKIDTADDRGNTALHLSVQKLHADLSKILIDSNASINNKNNIGETPLHLAVSDDSLDNVKLLIKNNAHVNSITNKVTGLSSFGTGLRSALHYAFSRKRQKLNVEIVATLIEAGADVNKQDQNGQTPSYLALGHDSIETLGKELIQKLIGLSNISIRTINSKTLLHAAAQNKAMSEENFLQLIEKLSTANQFKDLLNCTDKEGKSALFYAVLNNDITKAMVLIEKNPDLNNCKNSSPLHEAIKNNNTELAIKLIILGADVDAKDSNNKTPIVYAAEKGNVEIIECLKKYNATFSGKEGELAIKKALLNNYVDAVIKLIEFGANPDVHIYPSKKWGESKSFGSSALSISISKVESSSSLLSNDGKDKTGYITDGDTPLHFAVMTNNKSLAEACLENKPGMVNSANDKGKTPAHFAIKILSPEMANILWKSTCQINPSQKCPGITNKGSFWNEARQNTLLMQAATRGFESLEQLNGFFRDENYQLTDKQLEIKKATQLQYQPKLGNDISISNSRFKLEFNNINRLKIQDNLKEEIMEVAENKSKDPNRETQLTV